MRPLSGKLLLLAAALSLSLASCGEDPTHVGRPPVVQGFSPSDQSFDAFVGDTLRFTIRAFDPDKGQLRSWFVLGDSVVGSGVKWNYVVRDTGEVTIEAFVEDESYRARIEWTIRRHIPVNLPPVVTDYLPIEPAPTVVIGRSLGFSVQARDPEGKALAFHFTVDDSVVVQDDDYVFVADRLGPRRVRAVVTDGVNFTTQDWNVKVTTQPDTIPPSPVQVTMLATGAEPGDVDAEWIAVGADGMEGIASDYLVRTSPAPILTEEDWLRASQRPNVPPPALPGETMRMTIRGIIPARYTYVAVRAEDDFGNLSPLTQAPGVFSRGMRITGEVRDAVTGDVLSDIHVGLAHLSAITAADGTFEFVELPPVDGDITASDDAMPGSIGAFYDLAMPYQIVHEDHVVLFLIPHLQMVSPYYNDFYLWFRAMTDTPGISQGTQQRRFELPIDLYVPDFVHGGLDYARVIKEIAAEFDGVLGREVFRLVDQVPDVGVSIRYRNDINYDNWGVTLWSEDRYPLRGRIEHRTAYADTTEHVLRLVSRHELGHALGLNHSVDPRHVMVGGTAPSATAMTVDEVRILRIRYNLPRGLDVRFYGQE